MNFWWLCLLSAHLGLVTAEDEEGLPLPDDDNLPDDQVDQWDTLPLPINPDLEADSDQLFKAELSEIRQESEAEIQAYNQLHAESPGNQASLVEEGGDDFRFDWFKEVVSSGNKGLMGDNELIIFNTDDFDSETDDVDGDSPFAPPI